MPIKTLCLKMFQLFVVTCSSSHCQEHPYRMSTDVFAPTQRSIFALTPEQQLANADDEEEDERAEDSDADDVNGEQAPSHVERCRSLPLVRLQQHQGDPLAGPTRSWPDMNYMRRRQLPSLTTERLKTIEDDPNKENSSGNQAGTLPATTSQAGTLPLCEAGTSPPSQAVTLSSSQSSVNSISKKKRRTPRSKKLV